MLQNLRRREIINHESVENEPKEKGEEKIWKIDSIHSGVWNSQKIV